MTSLVSSLYEMCPLTRFQGIGPNQPCAGENVINELTSLLRVASTFLFMLPMEAIRTVDFIASSLTQIRNLPSASCGLNDRRQTNLRQ